MIFRLGVHPLLDKGSRIGQEEHEGWGSGVWRSIDVMFRSGDSFQVVRNDNIYQWRQYLNFHCVQVGSPLFSDKICD